MNNLEEAELEESLTTAFPDYTWIVRQTISAWWISAIKDRKYITIPLDCGNIRDAKEFLYYGKYMVNRFNNTYIKENKNDNRSHLFTRTT